MYFDDRWTILAVEAGVDTATLSTAATDRLLQAFQPGSPASFMRVFDVLEGPVQEDALILHGTCGGENSFQEITVSRNVDTASYRVMSLRVERGAVLPIKTDELKREGLKQFLVAQPRCHLFVAGIGSGSIVVRVDASGHVVSVSRGAGTAPISGSAKTSH